MSKQLGSKEDVQNTKKIIKAFVQQVYPAASALIKDVPEQSSDSTAKTAKELVDLLTKAIKKGNVSIPVSIKVQSTSDSDDSDDDSSEEESSEEDSSEEESGDKEALKAPSTAQHRASSETISAFSVNSDDAESAMSVENSKILEVDASKPKVVVVTEEESSDSSSDSDSESDSDSSSSSDSDAQEGSLIKKIVEIVPGNKEEEESDDSSDSSSSSSSSGSDSDSQSSSSSSSSKSGSGSSSDSDSDSDSDSGSSSSSSSSSSSGDSSSSSESDSDSSDDSDSDSESDSDSDSNAKVGGKRKRKGISKSEPPSKRVEKITTETVASPLSTANVPTSSTPVMQTTVVKNMPRKSGSSSVNTPFQRVKSDDAVYVNDVLRDNSFDAHLARLGRDDFGAKASQKLLQTRGQGFTKAKNKLKKGSYSGGTIGMESSSFKFVYSDEE